MAGLYIHIPFCTSRCYYCDFFSQVDSAAIPQFVAAMVKELEMQAPLQQEPLESIYLGGGTPSLLPLTYLGQILDTVYRQFSLSSSPEITIEGNPDDITQVYAQGLSSLGFNRVSLGVQSLIDTELKQIGRRHNAKQVVDAVEYLRAAGFQNLSLDLIYGLPSQSLDSWQESVERVLALTPQHISAYGLTYEEGTMLSQMRETGKISPASEELYIAQYDWLVERLVQVQYERYEVSNFAKQGYHSRHNSSYWQGKIYYGVGPAAHAFDGSTRSWNEADLTQYVERLTKGLLPRRGSEKLSPSQLFDEMIMLGLRTTQGVSFRKLEALPEVDALLPAFNKKIEGLQARGLLTIKNGYLRATDAGFWLLDGIIANLFH